VRGQVSSCSQQEPHDNEASGSRKEEEFFDSMSDYQVLKKDSAPRSSKRYFLEANDMLFSICIRRVYRKYLNQINVQRATEDIACRQQFIILMHSRACLAFSWLFM
jgi:hypothetical protein